MNQATHTSPGGSHHRPHSEYLYGLVAEFASPEALLEAARKVREAGYRCAEAYSPFAVEGLSEALGFQRTRVPLIVLLGGLIGGLGGFLMQYYANVVSYTWNIGGKPLNSWPAWIPITFELTILGAALAAVLGMLGLNKLPQPYHPLFHVERFQFASRDRFFICIEAIDPRFELEATRRFMEELAPLAVMEVPK